MFGDDAVMSIVYFSVLIFVFFVLPLTCFYVKVENRTLSKICPPSSSRRRRRQRLRQRHQTQHELQHQPVQAIATAFSLQNDRQGNIYTISDETSANRYADIFYIEPNSVETERIRAQLEKDDKDLPSYDEVMRMYNENNVTAAATAETAVATTSHNMGSPSSNADTVITLPAPPYSATDPHAAVVPTMTQTQSLPTHADTAATSSTSRTTTITNETTTVPTMPQTVSNTRI